MKTLPPTIPSDASWAPVPARCTRDVLVVEALLTLTEPTHVGGHPEPETEVSDLPLLTDSEGAPLLLGTSCGGALRAYLRAREFGFRRRHPTPPVEGKAWSKEWSKELASATVALFGGVKGDNNGLPSPLIVDDARSPTQPLVVDVRDGVVLNDGTGTAEDQGLFSMECWAAGVQFPLRFELHLPSVAYPEAVSGDPADVEPTPPEEKRSPDALSGDSLEAYHIRLLEALCGALEGFEDGWITFGGRRRRGFGAVRVDEWRVRRFNLVQPTGLFGWLRDGDDPLSTDPLRTVADLRAEIANLFAVDALTPFADHRSWVDLNLDLQLDGSILIRSSSGTVGADPDDVHLQAPRIVNGSVEYVDVLGGSSLGGALAARARANAHTAARHDTRGSWWDEPAVHEEVERILRDLFGYVPELQASRASSRSSRLHTRQAVIEKGPRSTNQLIQQSVSIDRHSGGAYKSALFDARPVFSDPTIDNDGLHEGGAGVEVSLRLLAPPDEALALVLLGARDLYENRMVIGGEGSGGRGRFRGRRFRVSVHKPQQEAVVWDVEGSLDPHYAEAPERLATAVESLRELQKV